MCNESIPRPLVEVYSKPGCCLCAQALTAIEAVHRRVSFELLERDVRQDAELNRRWRYDIPVVCIDGKLALKGRITEEAFERCLQQALARPASSSPGAECGETGPASPGRHSNDLG